METLLETFAAPLAVSAFACCLPVLPNVQASVCGIHIRRTFTIVNTNQVFKMDFWWGEEGQRGGADDSDEEQGQQGGQGSAALPGAVNAWDLPSPRGMNTTSEFGAWGQNRPLLANAGVGTLMYSCACLHAGMF